MHRRKFLVAAGAAALAGCLGGDGSEDPGTSYGDWFDGVDNYGGEVDRTGRGETAVAVGAADGFAFEPAAVVVSPGTTVVWEWTGNGGGHNVVATGGAFESDLVSAAGHTFEHAFPDPGLFRYFCEPHRDLGMRGGVRVVERTGNGG